VNGRDQRAGRNRSATAWLIAWRIVRRLPEPVAGSLGVVFGLLYWRLDARRREALRANLRKVLGPSATPAELERVVRRGFVSYARYWAEAFQLERLNQAQILRRTTIQGREYIDQALAGGHGAIFATPHVGNWDAGAAWLVASGYKLTTVVERLEPTELFERFVAYRRALGMEILPLDDGSESLRGLLRALRAGRLVALVCDRDLTGHGLAVRMFGDTVTLPGGPASLALKTGAPLLPCSVYHDRRLGHWVAVVHPPVRLQPSGDQRVDALALTQLLATEFERLIRQAPEQWHVLSRFWRGARPGQGSAGVEPSASTAGEASP
jgi:lauroyl/myristoyl acyltransferase